MLWLDAARVTLQVWSASLLSIGYGSCEKRDLCPVQDIEVVADCISSVMWGAIRMDSSPIGGTDESACPAESNYEVVCCAGAFIGFLQTGVRHSF